MEGGGTDPRARGSLAYPPDPALDFAAPGRGAVFPVLLGRRDGPSGLAPAPKEPGGDIGADPALSPPLAFPDLVDGELSGLPVPGVGPDPELSPALKMGAPEPELVIKVTVLIDDELETGRVAGTWVALSPGKITPVLEFAFAPSPPNASLVAVWHEGGAEE